MINEAENEFTQLLNKARTLAADIEQEAETNALLLKETAEKEYEEKVGNANKIAFDITECPAAGKRMTGEFVIHR